jgi:hypothetical protein
MRNSGSGDWADWHNGLRQVAKATQRTTSTSYESSRLTVGIACKAVARHQAQIAHPSWSSFCTLHNAPSVVVESQVSGLQYLPFRSLVYHSKVKYQQKVLIALSQAVTMSHAAQRTSTLLCRLSSKSKICRESVYTMSVCTGPCQRKLSKQM